MARASLVSFCLLSLTLCLSASADDPPYQRVLTGDDAKKAAELEKKIGELQQADTFAEAVQAAQELLALRRRVQGADHWETTDARILMEKLSSVAGQPEEVRKEAARFRGLLTEGTRLREKGQYAEAEQTFQKALAIAFRTVGDGHPDAASCYSNLAIALAGLGKHSEAEHLYQKALDICRRALGEEHPRTANGYNNLASNLSAQGKLAAAEPLFRRALDVQCRLLGEEHLSTAMLYNNVAYVLQLQGRYAEAAPLMQKALDVLRRLAGEDNPSTALAYSNLASVLSAQGDYAAAQPLFEKAFDIKRRVLGEDHPDTALGYHTVASNLSRQREYQKAQPHYQKALAIRRKALGEDHPLTALSYNSVAYNLHQQRDYATAEPPLRRAIDSLRRRLGESHPDTALSRHNLAMNLHAQGKHAEAQPLFEAALDAFRRLGEDHPLTAHAYHSTAGNRYAAGQYAEAESFWTRAVESYEMARLSVSTAGLERAVFGARESPLPFLAACQARLGKPAEGWQHLERHLARGLLDETAARRTPTRTAEERTRQQDLLARRRQLEQQSAALLGRKGDVETLRGDLDELARQRALVQTELAGLNATWSGREVLDHKAIQASLPADAALLAWIDVPGAPGDADPNGDHWACVLRREGAPRWVRLRGNGPGGNWTIDDDRLPARLREEIATQSGAVAWRDLAGRMFAQRLEPLEPFLKDVRQLLVVPAGWMAGVPVDVLTGRFTVSYVPSGTVFARLHELRRDGERRLAPNLLALGDPAFARTRPDSNDALSSLHDRAPAPLPGTRLEVESIAWMFPRAMTLLGGDASKQRLQEMAKTGRLKEFAYLHLATHGVIDVAEPKQSALLLARTGLPEPRAQERLGEQEPHGRLLVNDILASWQLNADLVTLSACETALGREGGGDGFIGFSQALFLAGARSVILSQWRVSDTATSLLMVRFYENLLGKRTGLDKPMPKAEALREAKHWLRNLTREEAENRIAGLPEAARGLKLVPKAESGEIKTDKPFEHPFYWSAFILIGDPN